jgi:hypothetical protein
MAAAVTANDPDDIDATLDVRPVSVTPLSKHGSRWSIQGKVAKSERREHRRW